MRPMSPLDATPDFELETADFALDPMAGPLLHQILKAYRERGPVQPTRFLGLPAFVITGHAALLEAFEDVERFPPHRMYQASFEGAIGESFISMESPERHRIYRKLATPAFRSRAVASYENQELGALARELVARLGDRDEFDLMADFAAQFPYLVITRLLGLPREREDAFHEWALALLQFRDDPVAAKKAGDELTAVLAPVVAARRVRPENDVISELVAARVDGRGLTDDEVYSHVRLLFPTGGETTHGSLGNLLYALLTHEGAWAGLREDRSRIELAVEEALRWETPIAVLPRMSASEPIEFQGAKIPADSWVLFAMAGANRDPEIFSDPDRFEIGRHTQEALSFGRGVKACPGMHLARRNLCVGLEALLDRYPELELLDSEAATPRRTVLRCPEALQVRSVAAIS
jgi:cytochrome P450